MGCDLEVKVMDLEFHIKAKVLHLSWYSSIIKTLCMVLNIRCTCMSILNTIRNKKDVLNYEFYCNIFRELLYCGL